MSRLRLRTAGKGVGPSPLFNLFPPELSGTPRQNEPAFIFAGGWGGGTPNKFRYDVQSDGISLLGFPLDSVDDATQFDWPMFATDKVPNGTVQASHNGGVTWSSPATPILRNFAFPSDVITAPARAAGTLTRPSTSGTVPMTLSVDIKQYSSDIWQGELYDPSYNLLWTGFRPVSDTELTTPFTFDLNAQTDPSWSPPLPAYANTVLFRQRLISADWQEAPEADNPGVASPWMWVSPTNTTGSRYIRIGSTSGLIGLKEIELAQTVAGNNMAWAANWTYFDESTTGNFLSTHLVDGIDNVGAITRAGETYMIGDFGIKRFGAGGQIRMSHHSGFYTWAPTVFTVKLSDDPAFLTGVTTVVNQSGVTWSSVADEVKSYAW